MKTGTLLNQLKGHMPLRGHVAVSTATAAAAAAPPSEIPDSLKHLPRHIIRVCPMSKLVMQAPYFECPEWADRPAPSAGVHFAVHKPADPSSGAPSQPQQLSPVRVDKLPYYILGQSAKLCDVKLDHPSISRLHCAVVHHRTGAVFVIDLNSANGVRVNGARLAKETYTQINDGDEVTIGASTRVFTLRMHPPTPKAGAAAAPPAGGPSPAELAPPAEAEGAQGAGDELPAAPAHKAARPESGSGAAAASSVVGTAGLAAAPASSGSSAPPTSADTAAAFDVPAPATTPAAPPTAAAAAEAVVVAHILIKHKDVGNPVSKAPRNKGAAVTRTLDDALRVAGALRMKSFAAAPVSEAAFEQAVAQFSECATAKKKGRMGRVERGQFAKSFEDAAFALAVHHVSAPVESPLGVHLLMRLADEEATS